MNSDYTPSKIRYSKPNLNRNTIQYNTIQYNTTQKVRKFLTFSA